MLKVLVVDDDVINQRVLTMQLERVGHQAHLAANGLQALEALEQEPFDLVLMDLQMPEMDGVRTTRLLRAREKATGGRVAVVAVTANTMPGERQRCLAAGMDDYLTKPIRSADLYEAIARAVERKPASAIEGGNQEVPPGTRRVARHLPEEGWLHATRGMGFSQPSIARLVQTFLEEVPGRVDGLREALTANDAPAVKAAAHALKGMLMVFSARAAVKAAESLEGQGNRRQLDGAAEVLAVLESEVRTLIADMKAFLSRNSPETMEETAPPR